MPYACIHRRRGVPGVGHSSVAASTVWRSATLFVAGCLCAFRATWLAAEVAAIHAWSERSLHAGCERPCWACIVWGHDWSQIWYSAHVPMIVGCIHCAAKGTAAPQLYLCLPARLLRSLCQYRSVGSSLLGRCSHPECLCATHPWSWPEFAALLRCVAPHYHPPRVALGALRMSQVVQRGQVSGM